jgi:UPF0755 protein
MSLFGGKSSEPRGPRSAEERERARLEREARRRERGGNPYAGDDGLDSNGKPFFDQEDPLATSLPVPDLPDEHLAEPPPPGVDPVWEDEEEAPAAPSDERPWDDIPIDDVLGEDETAALPPDEDATAALPPDEDETAALPPDERPFEFLEEPAAGEPALDEPPAEQPTAVEEPVVEEPPADEPPATEPPPAPGDTPTVIRTQPSAGEPSSKPAATPPAPIPPAPVEPARVEKTAAETKVDPAYEPSSNGTGEHAAVPQDTQAYDVLRTEDPPAPGPLTPAAGAEPKALVDDQPSETDLEPIEPVAPALPPRLRRFRRERGLSVEPASRRERRKARKEERHAPPPRVPRPPARDATDEHPKRSLVGRIVVGTIILIALVAVAVTAWFAVSLYQPFAGEGGDRVRVRVPSGLTAREIGDLLADQGVVSNGFFFAMRARLDGNRDSLKAGTYTFKEDMPYDDAMKILVKGPPPIKTVKLTLPEGNTVRDYASAVDKSKKVKGKYMRAVRGANFSTRRYGAPSDAPLEGFMFPATYELRQKDATAKRLVSQQLSTFKKNFGSVSMRRAKRANLTPYEVLIIASMVERETALPRERKLIAGVIYNRLKQSIPLGIDATIRYATNNWTRPIKESELATAGPYNTRLNQGLPPTPIGNPGLDSIKAAANPAKTKYLFFVVKPGGDGSHAFSETLAEFNRDVAKYNNARDAAGGKDPSGN